MKSTKTRNWVKNVNTVSTFPQSGTFTKSATQVAKIMAQKEVSPKGLGSGIRMIQYFINRAGKNLPAERRRALEKAKKILQKRLARNKQLGRT
jgi:hypothetical protein